MKTACILSLFVMLSAAVLADEPQISTFYVDGISQSNSFAECMDNPAFSQIFDFNGLIQMATDSPIEWAIPYNAVRPFNTIRYWQWDNMDKINDDNIITITLYSGPPDDPGTTVVYTTTASYTLQPFAYIPGTIYQIDIELPVVIEHLSGYIGVTAYNPDNDDYFFSFFMHQDNSLPDFYFNSGAGWESNTEVNVLLCLGEPPVTPITHWALYISALLMVVFVAFRFSKR